MGYYTYYSIHVLDENGSSISKEEEMKIIKKIRSSNENCFYNFDEEGNSSSSSKWYEWETELTEISKMFPKNILQIYGDGEESDDYWVAYFMYGNIQKSIGRITYEPPNLGKIKPKKYKKRNLKIKQ
jgi:hypothetical protein